MGNSRIALPFAAVFVLVASACSSAPPKLPSARVETGALEGRIEGVNEDVPAGDVHAFLGIPYAAPPVGDLRWREPQLAAAWEGVRDAKLHGDDCAQPALDGDPGIGPANRSEDCLRLSVWRPVPAEDEEEPQKLAVFVWFHGGGFVNGGTSAALYDGSALARQGLVVVGVNYRLGRLGFFAHPALSAAAEGALGNYALQDQLAALRWVQQNIAAFGGDPGLVTIAGQSAGGISVMHLLTSEAARGLFHRAVVMSGGGRSYLLGGRQLRESSNSLPSAEASGVAFAESAGIEGSGPEALAALRALPVEQVNGDLNLENLLAAPPTYAGGPIVDGTTIAQSLQQAIDAGKLANVPILIGTTSQDAALELPAQRDDPLAWFGAGTVGATAAYDPRGTLKPEELLLAIGVDMSLHEPARFVARTLAAAGAPAFLYRFDYVAQSLRSGAKGCAHAEELPYLFGTLESRYGDKLAPADVLTSVRFQSYVANFAKRATPNDQYLPGWRPCKPTSTELMVFTRDHGPVMRRDPLTERLDQVESAHAARSLIAPLPDGP